MAEKESVDHAAAKEELDEILLVLQAGDLDVDVAIRRYERGLQLIEQLESYLKTAENTVKKLQPKPGKE